MDAKEKPLIALEGLLAGFHQDGEEELGFVGADRDQKVSSSIGAEEDVVHGSLDAKVLLAEKSFVIKVAIDRKFGEA
jgi:hypothetical protein